jgi:hypothetical protein
VLGGKARLYRLGVEDATENHCYMGAFVLLNRRLWIDLGGGWGK